MSTVDPFARDWTILQWSTEGAGVIPSTLFRSTDAANDTQGSTLQIVYEAPLTYNLSWKDDKGEPCFIDGLSLQGDILVAASIPMQCGAEPVPCMVVLSLCSGQLRGTIIQTQGFGDGNVGTFTAAADPTEEKCPAPRRSPFWLRWFRPRTRAGLDKPRLGERTAAG